MTMAAAVQVMRSSAASDHHQEPSTAPVLEFACLFTHDLRRKQKRWQDGRLKYHTFNKRIMVYDERGNFIGDTHWREDNDLNEGDEVQLERGGVIVQVAECTGSRDQDLSELIDKRAQQRAERQAAALARRQPTLEVSTTLHAAAPHFQLRHKPLHHLIGTPTGHHGRALIPTESPYEERQKLVTSPHTDSPHPAKRRKREISPPSKGGYAQSLFGAALTLSGTPTSTPLIRNRPSRVPPIMVNGQSLVPLKPGQQNQNSDCTPTPTCAATTSAREESEITNLSSRGPGLNKVKPRFGEGRNAVSDASLTVALGSEIVESSSAVLGPIISVQSQGFALEPKRGNQMNSPDGTKERRKLAQEQPIDGPRIELRIRPRRKRGLLMVSESLDTDNSSSSKKPKNRTIYQNPTISSGDAVMRGSNDNMFDGGQSIDVDAKGSDHIRRKKPSIIDLEQSTASDAEPDLSCNMSSLKSKSKRARHIETKKERPGNAETDVSEYAPKVPSFVIDGGYPKETELLALHNKGDVGCKMADDSAHEDAISTNSSGGGKQPAKKKRTLIENIIDPCTTAERCGESQGENELILPNGVPAPRLAQLGRKSIRSREVIGFIFDEQADRCSGLAGMEDWGSKESLTSELPANHSKTHLNTSEANHVNIAATDDGQFGNNKQLPTHQPAKEIRVENNTSPKPTEFRDITTSHTGTISSLSAKQPKSASAQINEDPGAQAPAPEDTTATRQPPAKKVVNPATRGKKAAKPSDAAGQVPQCPLPSEAAVGKPLELGKHQNNRSKARPETRTKEAPIPGFARANGGPWSREAHDLFEFTRPP
ncbi:hypothetical protein F4776DRAFT_657218 [Hypoxylon sp. NC0597]|nr:hypothetical protein F4776DRAFT_657218 [Hypoxylon sp. NC0597]